MYGSEFYATYGKRMRGVGCASLTIGELDARRQCFQVYDRIVLNILWAEINAVIFVNCLATCNWKGIKFSDKLCTSAEINENQ